MVNLPFLQKKEESKKYFLTLLLKPYRVGAILFEEIDSKLFIVSTKEEEQEAQVDDISKEGLVLASDKVVSYVESSIPEEHTLEKTIFSVPYSWVDGGKIKPEYLEKLKKVCTDLGFKPEGFIVSIEAIVKFLQEKEGAPISSIFVEVARDMVFIYIVKGGQIIDVKSGKVEGDVVKSVEDLLLSIHTIDVLPSKIVLLDYDGAEDVQQDFISFAWSKEIPFLHVPQVVVLEKGFENEAIVNGVAMELGTEVLSDLKAGHEAGEDEIAPVEEFPSEEFGFEKEKDLRKAQVERREELIPVEDDFLDQQRDEKPSYVFSNADKSLKSKIINALSPFLSLALSLKRFVPQLSNLFGRVPKRGGLTLGVVGVILFAFLVSSIYYNFILHAEVSIFAEQKTFDKEKEISFVPDAQISQDTLTLLTATEEVSGDKTQDTTGIKKTGEIAKGEVTIYNKTEGEKKFAKGTVIIGTNSLEFQTLDDVTVASTSSFSTNFSNIKVKVQASTFGKEYNLPSATNFTVKGFPTSSFFAKNDNAIAGGTTKESTVVSKKDIEALTASFISELEKKAMQQASGKIADGTFLPVSLSSDISDKNVTKKEGDEASSVGISGNVKFKLGYYTKNDIESFVKMLSKGQVPDNYSLNLDSSNFEIKDIVIGEDGGADGKISIKAIFSPKLEIEKIAKNISGKGTESAEKIIGEIAGVSDVNIVLKNKLPLLPALLPKNPKNIKIEIKS